MEKEVQDENSDILLEGTQAMWNLTAQGSVSGTYLGSFKFKCFLSPTQKIAADREYREMMGPYMNMAPQHETLLAYALTQLKYRIVSAPPFWQSTINNGGFAGDIPDENIISMVLDAAIRAEVKYKNQFKKRTDIAIKDSKSKVEEIKAEQESQVNDKEDTPMEAKSDES